MDHINYVSIIFMFVFSYAVLNLILDVNTYFHLNKVYMALSMAFFMGIMEAYMVHDTLLLVVFTILTIVSILLMRDQILINENEFLKSMIEHHQMALLMSDKILKKKSSKFTKKLAIDIIKSQQEQIDEMKQHLI